MTNNRSHTRNVRLTSDRTRVSPARLEQRETALRNAKKNAATARRRAHHASHAPKLASVLAPIFAVITAIIAGVFGYWLAMDEYYRCGIPGDVSSLVVHVIVAVAMAMLFAAMGWIGVMRLFDLLATQLKMHSKSCNQEARRAHQRIRRDQRSVASTRRQLGA